MARPPLLRGDVIDSPRVPSGRGWVWNITGVGWGDTGSERFAILQPRHPPPPSSLAGAAAANASALRGGPWGGTATLYGLVASPTPLARVLPRPGPGQRRNLTPLPPPSYPRMTLLDHAISARSLPGGYDT